MKNKIKFSNEEDLWVQVIIGESVDQFGRKTVKAQWVKVGKDFNIGSVANPVEEFDGRKIIGFKWKSNKPVRMKDLSGFFGNMFG